MIDYDAISRENERGLGTWTDTRKSQISHYADPAHFVYELLQNADDREAKWIEFRLLSDRLIVEHNAKERFTVKHIEAISRFERGTNHDELLTTGKFGLGFKSVFAFTATPRIFSRSKVVDKGHQVNCACGDIAFEIYDLYRLRPLPTPVDLDPELTRFELPFNHFESKPKFIYEEHLKSPETAREIIHRKFEALEDIAILFTRNLAAIRFTGAGAKYCWSRVPNRDGTLTINAPRSAATFRIWEKEIEWQGKKQRPVQVAVRFDDGGAPIPSDDNLVATFPTSISTGMGIILNGPFRTTPTRETVGETDEFNRFLIERAAELLAKMLREQRDAKRLSVELLEILPIAAERAEDPGLFSAIHKTIRTMLVDEAVLPTAAGGYAAGNEARIARGQYLTDLFSDEQLTAISRSERPLHWLSSEITETNTERLNRALVGHSSWHSRVAGLVEGIVVRPEDLLSELTTEFLEAQHAAWLSKLYSALNDNDLPRAAKDVAARRPIVRLSSRECPPKHVPVLNEEGRPSAYLPGNAQTKYPTVDGKVLRTAGAKAYFISSGYHQPDTSADVFERLLPKYQKDEPKVSFKAHLRHLSTMLKVADDSRTGARLLEELRHRRIVLCFNAASQEKRFCFPSEAYFWDAGLASYFAANPSAWVVARDYETVRNIERVRDLFGKLGVKRDFPRELCGPGVYRVSEWGSHERGIAGFHPDWNLDGLDFAASHATIERAAYMWNDLLPQFQQRICGKIQSSSRQDFPASHTSEEFRVSPGGGIVREREWIPDSSGQFRAAEQIENVDSLHAMLERNDELLSALGRGASTTRIEAAKALGITPEVAAFVKEHTAEIEKLMEDIAARRANRASLDNARERDRERRRRKLLERKAVAPVRTTVKKMRSVPAYPAGEIDVESLCEYYREEGRLFCQICLGTMPFQQRRGGEYSECETLLTKAWAKNRDVTLKVMTPLNLVLCPTCGSFYREYVHKDHKLQDALFECLTNRTADEVTIRCSAVNDQEPDRVIHFDPTHLADIRDLLETGD
jgi:hypothetical protein